VSDLRLKGVITFGDPFNGAPIKGYDGPIEIYCAPDDGVCSGNFEVTAGHLSYLVDSTIPKAKNKLIEMANGGGDSKCCHPRPVPAPPSPAAWEQSIKANGGKIPKAKPGTTIEQWEDALIKSNGGIPQYSQRNQIEPSA
jgi:Cutinase